MEDMKKIMANFVNYKNMNYKICFSVAFMIGVALQNFAQAKKDSTQANPVVFVNGKPASDTLKLSDFERIDYIKGKQAIELMGPRGKDGIYLISSDGKIPVYGVVQTSSGKKVTGGEVISESGAVLTKTNECGTFFLPTFRLYEKIIIRKKGFEDFLVAIDQTEVKVKLVQKRK
jgi:hypothetical protein